MNYDYRVITIPSKDAIRIGVTGDHRVAVFREPNGRIIVTKDYLEIGDIVKHRLNNDIFVERDERGLVPYVSEIVEEWSPPNGTRARGCILVRWQGTEYKTYCHWFNLIPASIYFGE